MQVSLNSFRSARVAVTAALAFTMMAMLSSCSLEQKTPSDTVHLTLQRKPSGASSAKFTGVSGLSGVSSVGSSTFLMITVSGEGMLYAPMKGSQCLGITIPSTVFVPASVTGQQKVELEVLVGKNRLVRLYQIEFNDKVALPNSGEAIHRYLERTRSAGPLPNRVTGDPLLLASALIPHLQGEQTVTLIDKVSPETVSCPGEGGDLGGSGPPPLYDSNKSVEMAHYSHWEGGTAQAPNPVRIWSWSGASTAPTATPDFFLRMEGVVTNYFASGHAGTHLTLNTSATGTGVNRYFYNSSSMAPAASRISTNLPIVNWGQASQAPYRGSLYFRQFAAIDDSDLTPTANWYGGELRAKQELKFSINTSPAATSGVIERDIPIQLVSGRPIKVELLGKVSVSGGVSYSNLYRLKISNELNAEIAVLPYYHRSLFTNKQWTTSNNASEIELMRAPVGIANATLDCPFQDDEGFKVSEKKLLAGDYCYLYFAIFKSQADLISGPHEHLYLESRVRRVSTGSEGYIQSKIGPFSNSDSSQNSFARTSAIYLESVNTTSYTISSVNTYGSDYLTVGSSQLVRADLQVETKGLVRVTSGITLFNDGSISLPRFINGNRVREATLTVLGTLGGSLTYQRMRVPFLSPGQISLVARYYSYPNFYDFPSGQEIKFNCPGSGTVNVSATIYTKLVGPGPTAFWSESVNVSGGANYFNYSGTVSVAGGTPTFSPGGPVGVGTYPYKNIDSNAATLSGQWGLGCW